MLQEIWKDIPGYEGLYQVSNLGRVKSLDRFVKTGMGTRHQEEIIVKPTTLNGGYLKIRLYKDGTTSGRLVHRLVAEMFKPNIENKTDVNHKNGDKTDNRVDNLEWVSHKENMQHAFAMGLIGGKHFLNNKGSKAVSQYDENMTLIETYPSMHEAERKTGIRQGIISTSVHRGSKVGGYIWKLAD